MKATRKIGDRLLALSVALALVGCQQTEPTPSDDKVKVTATEVRAERRAYDGSPPVIPHQPLGAACTTCHTDTGKKVPNMAFAPANPHGNNHALRNCRQCHVFKRDEKLFVENSFVGLPATIKHGERLFATAPPTIPHSLLMRDNCNACHSGPTARPEIRCTHPERTNCRQCHVESFESEWHPLLLGAN